MEVRKVVWDKSVLYELDEMGEYLSGKSIEATKIISTLVKLGNDLTIDAEIYNLDRFKINNDGSYRAFEKYHYRVSYRIIDFEVRILRIQHTSRNPKVY